MKRINRLSFGVNDAGYPTSISKRINGKKKTLWRCPFYQTWANMFMRCYSPEYHAKFPTYVGCFVAQEWHQFSSFRSWMAGQPWDGRQLDKDTLSPGNKQYGPDTCVFVTRKLNMFLVDRASSRGEWPLGVYLNTQEGKFQSQCNNPFTGKHEYLGRFDNPESAHDAWRLCKHRHACRYADMQDDERLAKALRVRFIAEKS